MKAVKKALLFFMFIFLISTIGFAQTTKIISYNIRYANTSDKENNWDNRKNKIVKLLKDYNPAIFGIQEGLKNQVNYINSSLTSYKYIGVGRDGTDKGEFSAIFYDTSKFNLKESGTFWLSETPDTVSIGWDANLKRICTYGFFEIKTTKEKIAVFNTHFDHIGKTARENSATLILAKINQLNTNNYPVILMGDFNVTPKEKPIQILKTYLNEASEISETTLIGPKGTFNGFSSNRVTKKIDYFFTKNVKILSNTHINDLLNNSKHISDHLPIMITLKY
ncbi:endonuclease/exonuclease/phosphatase family protein [Lutibacter sp.]